MTNTKINPLPMPAPPKHLAAATRAWWKSVVEDYSLEQHHLRLLQLAGEAWDRGQQARRVLTTDGLTTRTETGLKAHPCIAIERDSRLAFARLIRELDLDTEPPAQGRRPPALRSNRRGH
jgi:phage terminase small subunit